MNFCKLSLLALALQLLPPPASAPAQQKLELKKGDRICLVGNTLADRMQHDGWLETRLQSRFPELQLVLRNLGFAGDTITTRPRSANFGSPDQHLTHCQADVIFAFFGYGESHDGEAGLPRFKQDLASWIDHTLSQAYNGQSPPRLVLLSPIAHEDHRDRLLPDGSENNQRLLLYTQAMSDVARQKGLPFVDLFDPSRSLYAKADKPLTINGIHLTEAGNRRLAEVIERGLFGSTHGHDARRLDAIRAAVLDKNLHWFNRYRATDGYSVFGGRSRLKFVNGQTNFEVMQRELEMLDVMTANRDRAVWAAAAGREAVVDDSNVPPPLEVISNKQGAGPDGKHLFLTGEQALERMKVHRGMTINLFASEEQFPELINPVQSAVDTDGRLWVAAWPTYPHWNPREELNDKLLILPDDDRDGRADRCIVFADGLHNPTGFEFWGGGVLVAQAPDILFLKDTDGDDKADVRLRVLNGIDSADTHHTANSFVIGPAGRLYFQRGVFHVTNVETPWGPTFRSNSTGMYRFDPRTYRFEKHFDMGPNPHGDVFDRWGCQFASDGTSGNGFYIGFPGRGTPKTLYQKRVRPVPALGLLGSEHFPEANRGNLLVCNVIGFQGIAQYEFVEEGAGFHCEEVEPIVYSEDPNFRPSDVEIGSDGALYFLDWHNPLIGHMQHNLRDPSRDHEHGRVYRVTVDGRPLIPRAEMRGRPIEEVLEHLKSPSLSVRYRARLELTGRDSQQAAAAAAQWADQFDPASAEHAVRLVEALWVHQQHKIPSAELMQKVLGSPEPRARAAATRVLGNWAEQIEGAGALLVELAGDEHPRVRHEAVVVAASFAGPEAAEALFAAEQWPGDQQLDFSLNEARKSVDIDGYIKQALASGRKLSPAAQAYMLRNSSVDDLMKLERTEAVYRAILTRPKVSPDDLRSSLAGLAELTRSSPLPLLLDLIRELDAKRQQDSLSGLSALLLRQSPADLQDAAAALKRLATGAKTSVVRQAGFAAWMIADGSMAAALEAAKQDEGLMRDLLLAVPGLPDELRGSLYDDLSPMISRLPGKLQEAALEESGIRVDYFHPNPKDVAVETLAPLKPRASGIVPEIEMEVPQLQRRDAFALRFTGTLRVGSPGEYTFWTNSDDGSRLYIGDQLVVNNDGLHGMVERSGKLKLEAGGHPLTVTYFDNGGGDGLAVHWAGPGFGKQPIPASRLTVAARQTLHDVAIETLASLPGHEQQKFQDFANLIRQGRHRPAAIAAVLRVPAERWPAERAAELAESVAAYVSEIPARYRTSPTALRALRLGDALAGKLEPAARRRLQARLSDLSVSIIRVGTVPHRMIYDKRQIAVEAGRTVEFVFSNTDNMPHNFVVVQPGAMEEVGLLGEATARDPDVQQREYIPKSDKILMGSRLLQPGQTQAISFEAPSEPGIYPYVCTYPGHWRRMYGAMCVVKDLKAYLADPDSYLASNPLPLEDGLLKSKDIDDKFRSYAFRLEDGTAVTGMILSETPQAVEVIVDPLAKAEPIRLQASEIAARKRQDVSIMPKGLLNKLSREEVLDLIAYVYARGDAESEIFQHHDHQQ